ncbi:PhzF family phenazine biosynthesis protein [Oleiagrimonas soli]|uniref:Phenazine biosynthesis protein PhzF n=1 Tax=Oleiagrimonas soli TaxID=1543381 RepID=A0A099CUA7_9GAMM|nr:PhzF family phenazine biosynthesis protein [Oleiagrimonas soli]KGI77281.1 phenazine biosynthesis protein PhzF [Oleiagrimonas soli]MBB6185515.1 PhzF family phenazine biosynthesis protein [Oleiagrimonas soli]
MPSRRYFEIDVFTDRALYGNPLAVIVDADDLDAAAMQRIATWTNFSETTFLLPPTTPEADYRVRIFTPRQELPFAGHPSVGSAFVALTCGRVEATRGALVQECAAGLLPVQVEGDDAQRTIRVQAPPARLQTLPAAQADVLCAALGTTAARPPQRIDNGPLWLTCDLADAATVRALQPDMNALAALCLQIGAVGACVFGRERDGKTDMAVRAFCPADGIPEDPVTGSANAAIAAYLHAEGGLDGYGRRYTASQGREVGRDGIVEVHVDAEGRVAVGGRCVVVVEGHLNL